MAAASAVREMAANKGVTPAQIASPGSAQEPESCRFPGRSGGATSRDVSATDVSLRAEDVASLMKRYAPENIAGPRLRREADGACRTADARANWAAVCCEPDTNSQSSNEHPAEFRSRAFAISWTCTSARYTRSSKCGSASRPPNTPCPMAHGDDAYENCERLAGHVLMAARGYLTRMRMGGPAGERRGRQHGCVRSHPPRAEFAGDVLAAYRRQLGGDSPEELEQQIQPAHAGRLITSRTSRARGGPSDAPSHPAGADSRRRRQYRIP